MELNISTPKRGFLPHDFESDPEENEISDDDDDRNHKHRRRETGSQSLERDSLEQVLTRPFKKRKTPLENGHHPNREANSQSSKMYKSYNISSVDRENCTKFGKRRHGIAPFSRAPLDLNQRIRANQLLSGGPIRGRGWEPGSWAPHDSQFRLADISSQMVQPGSVPSSLFSGRGMQNSSTTSWSSFGLVQGMPNNGMDTVSLGLQARPPINPSINIGITHQRCRDFEEQGFCLRGDMCPMEHGTNRIVVEDVQSLSQFNLPVSLPSGHLLGPPAAVVPLPSIIGPSTTMMNTTKGVHTKISKPGAGDNPPGLNSAFNGSAVTSESDLYDPDQPLWANDSSKKLNAVLSLNPSNDVTESLLGGEPSDDHVGIFNGSDSECSGRRSGIGVGSQSTNLSPWGRIGSSRNVSETREKPDSIIRSSDVKEEQMNVEETVSQFTDSTLKTQSNTSRMMRRPSQRATRTLFVRGIPLEINKKESLLSHFKKFGEVIDIYIPLNTDRAFVQFSKREEAEAALRAPDAVMGNRFIKLWWANRDNKPDDGTSSGNSVPSTRNGAAVNAVQSQQLVSDKLKGTVQSASTRGSFVNSSVSVPNSDHTKGLVIKGPKATPASQKAESLESLKEEIRKKQEMLDQKRNDFRLKLEKLEKQTIVIKGEVASKQDASKVRPEADVAKAEETSSTTGPNTVVPLPRADNTKASENLVAGSSHTNENVSFKQLIRPLAPPGSPFIMNRFKLDNRPTSFKIIPPLPTGLADVSVLKEHFSTFGDLSSVNLKDLESNNAGDESVASKILARISFTRRHSAELAFLKGKSWRGHNLHFMWLATSSEENPSSSSKGSSDTNNSIQPALEVASTVPQKDSISGEGESENLEKRGIVGVAFVEPDEDLLSTSTAISSEKQLP